MPDGTSRPRWAASRSITWALTAGTPCCRRSRSRKSARTPPFDKVCYRLRRHYRDRRRHQHCEGRARRQAIVFGLGGIGSTCCRPAPTGADMIIGVDIGNDRKAWGRFGMTHAGQSATSAERCRTRQHDEVGRRPDQRRRLHVRLYRQRHRDAAGAGSLPSRLGSNRSIGVAPSGTDYNTTFSSLPAGSGRHRSVARAAAPVPKSSTGTCRARSRSTR